MERKITQETIRTYLEKNYPASQMSDAILERTTAKIHISTTEQNFVAKGEMIKFDGFMKLYLEGKDEEIEEQKGMLPKLNKNDKLDLK